MARLTKRATEMIRKDEIRGAIMREVEEAGLSGEITRVGADVYDELETVIYAHIRHMVTISPPYIKTLHANRR